MSSEPQADWWISPEEYLAGEERAAAKHEYVCGLVYAVPEAPVVHHRITVNIVGLLHPQLLGHRCEVLNSNTRIRIRDRDEVRFYYPDALVVCEALDLEEVYVDEPAVLFEVLSAATTGTDLREKWPAYRHIGSVRACAFIDTAQMEATVYSRTDVGWKRRILRAPEDEMEFPSIACSLRLSDLYQRTGISPA